MNARVISHILDYSVFVLIPSTGRMFHEFNKNGIRILRKEVNVSIPLTGRMFHEFKIKKEDKNIDTVGLNPLNGSYVS